MIIIILLIGTCLHTINIKTATSFHTKQICNCMLYYSYIGVFKFYCEEVNTNSSEQFLYCLYNLIIVRGYLTTTKVETNRKKFQFKTEKKCKNFENLQLSRTAVTVAESVLIM